MRLCIALLASATAWSPPRPPRSNRIRLREGAFPEPDFARGRQSLRGLWRLQRTCEDEGDCQDIVVNLKASGTFTATSQGDDEAMSAFAEKLQGRWYCDGEDQELRLARFERQSPVEWYTGMPANRTAPLSAIRGHVTFGASEPEWIGRFAMEPLWPETHAALPRLPADRATKPFAAPAAAAGAWFLVCTGGVAADDDERVAFEVVLHENRTWETIDGFDGSASRREGGISVSAAGAASLRDLVSLERAAASSACFFATATAYETVRRRRAPALFRSAGPAVEARNCTVRERRVGLPRAAQVGHERHGELRPRPLLVPAREERKLGGT